MTIKNPTCGRIVHVYMNGYRNLQEKYPGIVISDGEENPLVTVFTHQYVYLDFPNYGKFPDMFQENIPHKEDAVEGKPYWDWPVTPPNVRP